MGRVNYSNYEKEELVRMIHLLKEKLGKRRTDLVNTKKKLYTLKSKLKRTEGIVKYQREKIVDYYKSLPDAQQPVHKD